MFTLTLPCTLWFLTVAAKTNVPTPCSSSTPAIYRQVDRPTAVDTRAIGFIANIVRLYRGGA
jgi:hypothetical protein